MLCLDHIMVNKECCYEKCDMLSDLMYFIVMRERKIREMNEGCPNKPCPPEPPGAREPRGLLFSFVSLYGKKDKKLHMRGNSRKNVL